MSDAAKEYAAGLAAGVATVVIGHPFDTVKVSPLLLIAIISTSSLFAPAKPFWGGGEFLGWGQFKFYLIRLLFILCKFNGSFNGVILGTCTLEESIT